MEPRERRLQPDTDHSTADRFPPDRKQTLPHPRVTLDIGSLQLTQTGNPVAMLEMTNASIPPPWASRVSGHHLSVGLLAAMESQEAEKAGGGNGTDQNRSAR
ncbi:hypothetical protein Q1695_007561 [Nippostrongylus brasiliensis]|nr:hypothetical protein Q1695_007561 [Nippostrongylus brasiliensis]